MSISTELLERAESKCELCNSPGQLDGYTVPPKSKEVLENQICLCENCLNQINDLNNLDSNHWRCLNESMWSQEPPVQVMAYRLLSLLSNEEWAADLLNLLFLNDDTIAWAQAGFGDNQIIHKDANGHVLQSGDSVVLIKDLSVKGANFIAKRGTPVRRISLVRDNAGQIEGRVNDQHIVILTEFVKKT
jgi:protein PhnA